MEGYWTALVGCYTGEASKGIYRLQISAQTGRCDAEELKAALKNPSYIIAAQDGKRIYTVLETQHYQGGEGGAVASGIWDGKNLEITSIQRSFGKDPCHLALDKTESRLFAANYSSGSCTVFPLEKSGKLRPYAKIITHHGKGQDPVRQEAAHVHCASITPDGRQLALCDLGLDRVCLYACDEGKISDLPVQEVAFPAGSGPRHLVWRAEGETAYVVNELANTVAVLKGKSLKTVQILPTIPADFFGISTCAAVKLSPDGGFLYVSNRGHDSIACYEIKPEGNLYHVETVSSEGHTPRDISLTPDGRFLLAANQEGGGITVFLRDTATGRLTYTGRPVAVKKPVCVCFLPSAVKP